MQWRVERAWRRWAFVRAWEPSLLHLGLSVRSTLSDMTQTDARPRNVVLTLYRDAEASSYPGGEHDTMFRAMRKDCYRGPERRCEIARVGPVAPGSSVGLTLPVERGIVYLEFREASSDESYEPQAVPELAAIFDVTVRLEPVTGDSP